MSAATPAIQSTSSTSSNNKIFIDGRAYEVRFVGQMAIIERNGLPHRVSFTGKPKDVVIDGVPFSLPFGGVTKEIFIDGRPLRLRFGAPSRELYVGSTAIKGAFGGPALYISINGVRHRIQLSGPPPEVFIDSEPAYELMRFLRRGSTMTPDDEPLLTEPSASSNTSQCPISQTQSTTMLSNQTWIPNDSTSNDALAKRPSEVLQSVVEKHACPLSTLTDFNINLLRIKYISIVDNLYAEKPQQCETCGLRFRANDRQGFSLHLNGHFRVSCKQETGHGYPLQRQWYTSEQDWLNFTEGTREKVNTAVKKELDDDYNGSTTNAQNGYDRQPVCRVCGEKLEQIWDEEDEQWKWNNAIVRDLEAYHMSCYTDGNDVANDVPIQQNHTVPFVKDEIGSDEDENIEDMLGNGRLPFIIASHESTSEPVDVKPVLSTQMSSTVFGGSSLISADGRGLLDSVWSAIQNVPASLISNMSSKLRYVDSLQPSCNVVIPGLSISSSLLNPSFQTSTATTFNPNKVKRERIDNEESYYDLALKRERPDV